MATNYPASLDTTTQLPEQTTLAAGDLDDFPHSAVHGNANDAIRAIEAELGTAPSGSFSTVKARLEAIESASWTAVSTVNSWAAVSGYDALRYRKVGDQVTLYGAAENGSATTIGTLPAGFRPAGKVRAAAINSYSTNANQWIEVDGAGVITTNTTVGPLFINMVFEAA